MKQINSNQPTTRLPPRTAYAGLDLSYPLPFRTFYSDPHRREHNTMRANLKEKTISAVRWTAVGSVARIFIQLLQLSVLTRMLTPSDYGLMAIVSVVIGFTNLLSDFGINSAFIQRRNVTESQRSSLFWFNVAVGFLLMLLLTIISPIIAFAFNDYRLIPLITIAATNLLIGTLGSQYRVAAEKQLRFKPVVIVEAIGLLIGFFTAATFATNGFGVVSLVLSNVACTLSVAILNVLILNGGWLPSFVFRFSDVHGYLNFGFTIVINNLVNELNRSLDLLICGRAITPDQLGLYSVPRGLAMQIQGLINPIATRVAFPLISEVQADTARTRSIYLKALNLTSSANSPAYLNLAFFSNEVTHFLLGPSWVKSAELLTILSIWGLVRSMLNPIGSLLLGLGRADLSLKWNTGLLFVFPPFVLIGSHYGLIGVSYALLLAQIALIFPGWLLLAMPLCEAGFWEHLGASWKPTLLATLGCLIGLYASEFVTSRFSGFATGVLISGLSYAILTLAFNQQVARILFELAGIGNTKHRVSSDV